MQTHTRGEGNDAMREGTDIYEPDCKHDHFFLISKNIDWFIPKGQVG